MVDLDALVVCAVCHADLPTRMIRLDGVGTCPRCGRRYACDQGTYNMMPMPPPDEALRIRWASWNELQANGAAAYTKAPEFNLSVGSRQDASAFKTFSQLSGLVLDVGCGPQAYPSYVPPEADLVGIDPLPAHQPHSFAFVRGLGEYLPFRDHTFDHVLFATSLDHTIDPRRALAEAARCMKPYGAITLWLDGLAAQYQRLAGSRSWRYRLLATKGLRALRHHNWIAKKGLAHAVSYASTVARMKVPAGAVDCFHFDHLSLAAVSSWLDELSLTIARQEEYRETDSLFVQAKMGGTP